MKRKNIAILLAGGKGVRINGALPKQFIKIEDKPMISYSLDTFQRHPLIDEILLVLPLEYIDSINQYIELQNYTKIIGIVSGGLERSDSTKSALSFIQDETANLLFHDVARPFLSSALITKIIEKLDVFAAVCPALPVTDTIFEIGENSAIEKYLSRKMCFAAQTPQAFHAEIIKKSFEMASQDSTFVATDDCSVVRHYMPGVPIAVVEGERTNMKITFPEDYDLASIFLQKNIL